MAEPTIDPTRLEAIVFDVDGTLYRQDSLRRAMAVRLLRAHITRPVLGWRTMKVLGGYRKAQEYLRDHVEGPIDDLAEAQLRVACERMRAEPRFVGDCVNRWMEQEPLSLLRARIQPGLIEFVRLCKSRNLKLGVLSDYPAEAKLEALGLNGQFDVVLTAQSSQVGIFKPNPRGLSIVMGRLGVEPAACLYVGDREEVDGAAASAAGVAYYIVPQGRGFGNLQQLLFGPATRVAQPVLDLP